MIRLLSVAIVAGLFFESNQQLPYMPAFPAQSVQPCEYPKHIKCWTDWFDRDNPSGTGDWETLADLRKENPGKICPNPTAIEARTVAGQNSDATGEVIFKNDVCTGFICRNMDQPRPKTCSDYEVRFACHPPFCGGGVCWTDWFDRDNPSGTGDWEDLTNLRRENKGKICETPMLIEAVTTDTMTPASSTGDTFSVFTATGGLVCQNNLQKTGFCKDYKVRFACPCKK